MIPLIPEVLKMIHEEKSVNKKKEILTDASKHPIIGPVLLFILRGAFDKSIEWILPVEKPPITFSQQIAGEGHISLYKIFDKKPMGLAYFCNEGIEAYKIKMDKYKRGQLYMQTLEQIHHTEAEMIMNMVSDRDLHIHGLTARLVNEVFPGLLRKME
jgi:hypothetical protein